MIEQRIVNAFEAQHDRKNEDEQQPDLPDAGLLQLTCLNVQYLFRKKLMKTPPSVEISHSVEK